MRICIDIGGTFTDFIAQDSSGRILLYKTLTTPQDYTEGIRTGLANLRVPANEVDMCVHGTTIAINTIIERKGARTALVTTKGFRDVLEIGRGNRPNSYNLFFNKADPLIPRSLRLEVTERANSRGEILTALDSKEAAEMAAKIADTDVEAVSVCFLHSYNNPANEESLGKMLRERLPHVYITLSHELLREAREYERTSTTAINAYVAPIMARYLSRLGQGLGQAAGALAGHGDEDQDDVLVGDRNRRLQHVLEQAAPLLQPQLLEQQRGDEGPA